MQANLNNKVSVIIPAFNAENYISETIESVLKQTHHNFEIIVVNDGSTDNTSSIVEELAKNDSRITIINKKNTGVADSRNTGLNLSNSEYIMFLDADDILLSEAIEIRISYLNQEKYDALYTAYEIINEKSEKLNHKVTGSKNISLDDVLLWKANYITIPSAFLYKTVVIKEINGYDNNLSNNADQDILIRLLYNNIKVGYINTTTWLYRKHQKNMSSNLSIMEKDTISVYKKCSETGYFKSKWFEKTCYANMYLILAGSWWKNGKNKTKGTYYILKAIVKNPIYTFKKLATKFF